MGIKGIVPASAEPFASGYVAATAHVSACGLYRWRLYREWEGGRGEVAFLMLNPSTADGAQDDPTVKKCVKFAKAWGYHCLRVVNLFCYRATDPYFLKKFGGDIVGTNADGEIVMAARECDRLVCAWGAGGGLFSRDRQVWRLLSDTLRLLAYVDPTREKVVCLGRNGDGSPKHPLYMRDDTQPVPFSLTLPKGS